MGLVHKPIEHSNEYGINLSGPLIAVWKPEEEAVPGTNAPTNWGGTMANRVIAQNYSLVNHVQWILGKHSLTGGAQIAWLLYDLNWILGMQHRWSNSFTTTMTYVGSQGIS